MIYWYQRKHLGSVSFKEWECSGPDLIKHGALIHEKQLSSALLLIKRLLSVYSPVQTVSGDDSRLCGALLPAEKRKRQQAQLCRLAAQCGTLPLTQQLVFR